jgi:hypothetical protein
MSVSERARPCAGWLPLWDSWCPKQKRRSAGCVGDKREVSRAGSGHFSALGFTGLRKRGCVGLTLAEGRMCLCGARRRANRTALLRLDVAVGQTRRAAHLCQGVPTTTGEAESNRSRQGLPGVHEASCGVRLRSEAAALSRLDNGLGLSDSTDRTGSALSDRLVGREHSVGRGRLRILGRGTGRKQFSLERSVGRQAPSGQELLGSAVVREPCQVMLDGFAIRAAGPGMAPVVPPLPGGRSSAPMVGRRGCSSSRLFHKPVQTQVYQ